MANRPAGGLDEFLERSVYPQLYQSLDVAFPEYGFKRKAKHWEATDQAATRALPGAPRPDRVYCYANRTYGLVVQGGEFVRFLDLVNGFRKPTGPEFLEAVAALAKKAGVPMPERQSTPEQAAKAAERHARRSALDVVVDYCRNALKTAPANVHEYVRSRGYNEAAVDDLGLGYLDSAKAIRAALQKAGHADDILTADDNGRRYDALKLLEDRVIYPWRDATGQLLTLYGDWPARPPPDGKVKLMSLSGGSKASPLHFDRARQAGHRDLVLVEGVADASLLQVLGDTRVIACLGSQLTGEQLDTIDRYQVQSVTICLDPDGAGEQGTLACIRQLMSKDIRAYVAPALPDKLDPDDFVRKDGIDAWRARLKTSVSGLRYMGEHIVRKHKADGWTDMSRDACIAEALAFESDISVQRGASVYPAISQHFLPAVAEGLGIDIMALAEAAGDAREKAIKAKETRAYGALMRNVDEKLKGGDLETAKQLLRDGTDRLWKEERTVASEPVYSVADELDAHREHLAKLHGREFLGLPQRTLPTLDKRTMGLRGLMLLAAAPNVGKTTLALQLGLDVVVNNPDAVFLLLSLEMSRKDMLTRLKSRLSGVSYEQLTRGVRFVGGRPVELSADAKAEIAEAATTLATIGRRIRILDDKNFPAPTLEKLLDQVADLREASGAKKVFVAVDYLQVWPIPDSHAKNHKTDIDADKWRIGQLKELRDELGPDGAVLVISEANKQSFNGNDSLTAVMGTARGTYTPDMVFLLRQIPDEELLERRGQKVEKGKDDTNNAAATKLREKMFDEGYDEQRLVIIKGRDGVRRGAIDLRHNFTKSCFEETNSAE